MMRILKLVFNWSLLYTLMVSCQDPIPQATDCTLNPNTAENINSEEEVTPTCEVPKQAALANLEINAELTDFNEKQTEKMNTALEQLRVVINSDEFKNRILNYEYQGKKTFVDNNGMSNQEVYDTIMAAAEKLSPEVDQEIDIKITLYYSNNSTVGYTYPDSDRIWVNNKFFAGYTLAKVAANVAHEWTHKLGFNHDFRRTARRNFSVPYGVGSIIQKMIEEMNPENSAQTETSQVP